MTRDTLSVYADSIKQDNVDGMPIDRHFVLWVQKKERQCLLHAKCVCVCVYWDSVDRVRYMSVDKMPRDRHNVCVWGKSQY